MRPLLLARAPRLAVALAAPLIFSPIRTGAQTIMPDTPAPEPETLEGRGIAMITGSTSGLGQATALALGERGWHVIVHGRDVERGRRVVEEIEAGPGSATFYAADLASVDETDRLADAVVRGFERLEDGQEAARAHAQAYDAAARERLRALSERLIGG